MKKLSLEKKREQKKQPKRGLVKPVPPFRRPPRQLAAFL